MSASVAARLAAALDAGEVALQRDGLSLTFAARDRRDRARRGPRGRGGAAGARRATRVLGRTRRRRPRATSSRAVFETAGFCRRRELYWREVDARRAIEALVAIAAELGVASLRAPLFACARRARSRRCAAAIETADEDVELAAALALGPRATRLPAEAGARAAAGKRAEPETRPNLRPRRTRSPGELEERVLEAARAAIPPGLLASLAARFGPRRRSASDGKSGEESYSSQRGRPLDARPGSLRKGRLSPGRDAARRRALAAPARAANAPASERAGSSSSPRISASSAIASEAARRPSSSSTPRARRRCSGWPRSRARSNCCSPTAMCGATMSRDRVPRQDERTSPARDPLDRAGAAGA